MALIVGGWGCSSHPWGVKVTVFARSSAVHLVAGWMASMTYSRAWRGGESSTADVAMSCWYLYSVAVMSLYVVWSDDALKSL